MILLIFFFSVLKTVFAYEPPSDARLDRTQFVSSFIRPGDVGVEIGVEQGVFAYHVLFKKQPTRLYLIDPWADQDEMFFNVCEAFAKYPHVEIMRKKSEDVASFFPDQFFDYVYIDGEHSYAAVKRDLANYFPKVKVGGYLIGDDYGWTGVAPAVLEFLHEHQNEVLWFGDPYEGKTAGQFAMRKLK